MARNLQVWSINSFKSNLNDWCYERTSIFTNCRLYDDNDIMTNDKIRSFWRMNMKTSWILENIMAYLWNWLAQDNFCTSIKKKIVAQCYYILKNLFACFFSISYFLYVFKFISQIIVILVILVCFCNITKKEKKNTKHTHNHHLFAVW